MKLKAWMPFLALVFSMAGPARAERVVTVLNDFETARDIDRFAGRVSQTFLKPTAAVKSHGQAACEVRFFMDCCTTNPPSIGSLYAQGDFPYANWSPYDDFLIDVFNPTKETVTLLLAVRDKQKTATFSFPLAPKKWATLRLPIAQLGERGVDAGAVTEMRFYQRPNAMSKPNMLYLDYLRLVGHDRAAIDAARRSEDATAAQRKRRPIPRTAAAKIAPVLSPTGDAVHFQRRVPVVLETGVIVVGGGLAGTAAAIAAAREGVRTLLIERSGCLGGMATSGLVPPAMRLELTEGISRKLYTRLEQTGGDQKRNPEVMKLALLEMVNDAGAKLMLYTTATDAVMEGNTIRGVIIHSKAGFQAVRGRVVVDCTGDGDIAASAGAPFEIGRGRDEQTQAVTLMFLLGNVDTSRAIVSKEVYGRLVRQAKSKGELHAPFAGGAARGKVIPGPNGVIYVNTVNVRPINGLRPADLTYAQFECHREIWELAKFYRKYVPGCERSYLLSTAAYIGVRETRRVVGEYMLTGYDVMQARHFDDEIARGFYPIDIHVADTTGDGGGFRPRRSYGIPYRCLVPKNVDNLLVAGRCISATHVAHGSVRVMGTTIALGEAAGEAAALAVKEGATPRRLDVKKLQARLKAHKALPVAEECVPDNLALMSHGTRAVADSIFKGGAYPPNSAIDAVVTRGQGSRWLSARSPEPHWLVVDFGRPRTFSKVRLHFYSPSSAPDDVRYAVVDYRIQIERDGQWVDVVQVRGNDKLRPVHEFPPVTARRIRFYVTKACRADSIVRLREIEVHAPLPKAP